MEILTIWLKNSSPNPWNKLKDRFETKASLKWLLYHHGSGHFFAICMFIFHKSEIQTVILKCLIGLNPNQQKNGKKWSEMIVKQWVMSNFGFETLFICVFASFAQDVPKGAMIVVWKKFWVKLLVWLRQGNDISAQIETSNQAGKSWFWFVCRNQQF